MNTATVQSVRLYSWALETRIAGPADVTAVVTATAQYRQHGCPQVWMLDAGGVTTADASLLTALNDAATSLRAEGLDRVALVLPPFAAAYGGVAAGLAKVPTRAFPTRAAATAWLKSGCR